MSKEQEHLCCPACGNEDQSLIKTVFKKEILQERFGDPIDYMQRIDTCHVCTESMVDLGPYYTHKSIVHALEESAHSTVVNVLRWFNDIKNIREIDICMALRLYPTHFETNKGPVEAALLRAARICPHILDWRKHRKGTPELDNTPDPNPEV